MDAQHARQPSTDFVLNITKPSFDVDRLLRHDSVHARPKRPQSALTLSSTASRGRPWNESLYRKRSSLVSASTERLIPRPHSAHIESESSRQINESRTSKDSADVSGLVRMESCDSIWQSSSPVLSFDFSIKSPILTPPQPSLKRSSSFLQSEKAIDAATNMFDNLHAACHAKALRAIRSVERLRTYPKDTVLKSTLTTTTSYLIPDSVLTLSMRYGNSKRSVRTATLTIPACHVSAMSEKKAMASQTSNFDDEALFLQLQQQYIRLRDPYPFINLRCLKRIVIRGRGPSDFVKPGDEESLIRTDDELLKLFRDPALGRGRHTFVQWARRIANVPTLQLPPSGKDGVHDAVAEDAEGIEFVMSWSLSRIIWLLAVIILVSVLVPLVWSLTGGTRGLHRE